MIFVDNRYKRASTPSVLQMEATECGAASLGMILGYFGKYVPLERLRMECGVSRDGVRASNIVKAAERMGLEVTGMSLETEDLKKHKMPMIIHWNFNHFVVLEGLGRNKAYINDPAEGKRKVRMEEFNESFTGIALIFELTDKFEKGGSPDSIWLSFARRLENSKSDILYVFLLALVLIIPGIIIPAFSTIFIDDILCAGKTYFLSTLLWAMAITAAIRGTLVGLQAKVLLRFKMKLSLVGSSGFFWHVLRLPVTFFQQRFIGDINSRITTNDSIANFLTGQLASNAVNIITMIFYFIVMLQYSLVLSLFSLLLASFIFIYYFSSSKMLELANKKMLQYGGRMSGFAVSGLRIIETLKATSSESNFFRKFMGYFSQQVTEQQKISAKSQILFAMPNLVESIANVFVLTFGAYSVITGSMTLGTLTAFQTLLATFLGPVKSLTQMEMQVKEMQGEILRLDDVLKYETDVKDDFNKGFSDKLSKEEQSIDTSKLHGDIKVTNLSFGYNLLEEPFIRDFNLEVKAGSTVALVGASGSGKSTIVKIISGLYQPWKGEIEFDGIKKQEIPHNVFSNSVAIVDQDISMFSDTITNNVTMWDDTINQTQLFKATRDACIHKDIAGKEKGYGTVLQEDAGNLSGGQRQRLEIARAMINDPSILILDEATSALDPVTEDIIMRNIKRRGCTCIIAAHRLSTIKDCDEIIVMDGGEIVQRGTHEKMKKRRGPYLSLIKNSK